MTAEAQKCTHSINDIDTAFADGLCPCCLATELATLRAALAEAERERDKAQYNYKWLTVQGNEERAEHESALSAAQGDAEYYKWRLRAVIPLLEEARDALPAITLASAKIHGVDLSLGARMDRAGTATRADYDAAISAADP